MSISVKNAITNTLTLAYQVGDFCLDNASRITYVAQEALYNAFGYETTWQLGQRTIHLDRFNQEIRAILDACPLANTDLEAASEILEMDLLHRWAPGQRPATERFNANWLQNSLKVRKLNEQKKQYELLPRSLYQIFKDYIMELQAVKNIHAFIERTNTCDLDQYNPRHPDQMRRDLQESQERLTALRQNSPFVSITCEQMLAILNSPDVLDENDPNYVVANAAKNTLVFDHRSVDSDPVDEPVLENPIKMAQHHLIKRQWAMVKGQELRLEREIARLEKALEPYQHD